jgi:hypothetical protein
LSAVKITPSKSSVVMRIFDVAAGTFQNSKAEQLEAIRRMRTKISDFIAMFSCC